MSKKSPFSVGIVLGAVIGGVAAYFLAPKSGPENREEAKKKLDMLKKKVEGKTIEEIVKEVFGKASDEGQKLYAIAREELNRQLDEVQTSMSEIDREKYTTIVKDVVKRVSEDSEATKDRLSKLQDYLMNRWDLAQEEAEKDSKKVAKNLTNKEDYN